MSCADCCGSPLDVMATARLASCKCMCAPCERASASCRLVAWVMPNVGAREHTPRLNRERIVVRSSYVDG